MVAGSLYDTSVLPVTGVTPLEPHVRAGRWRCHVDQRGGWQAILGNGSVTDGIYFFPGGLEIGVAVGGTYILRTGTVLDASVTDSFTLTFDSAAGTLTISGATTGNGTYAGTPWAFSAVDTYEWGSDSGGTGHLYTGTITAIVGYEIATGTSAGVAGSSATLVNGAQASPITGTTAGVASSTATLTAKGVASGTASGAAASTASLAAQGYLAGAVAGAAAAAGTLRALGLATASTAGVAGGVATAAGLGILSGVAAGVATASAGGGVQSITGVAAGVALVAGALVAAARAAATVRPNATKLVGRRARFPVTSAPDIAGLPWRRPPLNGWTTPAQRDVIRGWLSNYFTTRQWPRGWELEEWLQVPTGQSSAALDSPMLRIFVWGKPDRSDRLLSTQSFDDAALDDLPTFQARLAAWAQLMDFDRSLKR